MPLSPPPASPASAEPPAANRPIGGKKSPLQGFAAGWYSRGVFAAWNPSQPEISDLIIQHDPVTLDRLPVRKDEVRSVFAKLGNRQAVKVIDALPARDGVLDAAAIDRLFIVVHSEMQRLAEEFYHGGRVWELLQTVIDAMRATSAAKNERIRVVDIGCGIGYTVRWLAARTSLAAQGVDLVGMDLNSALIQEASRLARAENLPCRFVHGDAFSPANSGHIYLSTGVLHHFRGDDLANFFRRHELPETQAFLYYDFQPSFLAAGPRDRQTGFRALPNWL